MDKKDNFNAVFKKYFQKQEKFLLPNILCYLRILLVPVFVTIYVLPSFVPINVDANVYITTGIMLFCAYTDFLDGFIARKFDKTSNLGKILDPLADKFMQLGIAVSLVIKFKEFTAVIILLTVFLSKEIWMMIMTIILARANRAFGSARWYGKMATFAIYMIAGGIFIGGPIITSTHYDISLTIQHIVIDGLSTLAISFLLLAAIKYTIFFRELLKNGQDEVTVKNDLNKEEEVRHD